MKIGLYKHSGFISSAIKWQTRSEYSHASLIFSDGVLIEATWPKVRKIEKPAFDPKCDYFNLDATPEQEKLIREFAEKQVGKSYDLTMVIRFVTRKQETRKSTGMWFCSELAFAAVLQGSITLLARTEPWKVSPEILSLSPLLYR